MNKLKERWNKNLEDNIDKVSPMDLTELKCNKKPYNMVVRVCHGVCSLTTNKVVFFVNEKEDGSKGGKPTNMP